MFGTKSKFQSQDVRKEIDAIERTIVQVKSRLDLAESEAREVSLDAQAYADAARKVSEIKQEIEGHNQRLAHLKGVYGDARKLEQDTYVRKLEARREELVEKREETSRQAATDRRAAEELLRKTLEELQRKHQDAAKDVNDIERDIQMAKSGVFLGNIEEIHRLRKSKKEIGKKLHDSGLEKQLEEASIQERNAHGREQTVPFRSQHHADAGAEYAKWRRTADELRAKIKPFKDEQEALRRRIEELSQPDPSLKDSQ